MSGWQKHEGRAVILPQANIDTDQLIPARFMSQPRSAGYGDFLLRDVRENAPDHPLDRHTPTVLIAGRNFGSGSSREAAVYALADYGIRAVLAPSFGDIFAGNATNNGLLAGRITEDDLTALADSIGAGDAPVTLDITTRRAQVNGREVAFEIDDVSAEKLVNGWDDIDLTAQHNAAITKFHEQDLAARPWAAVAR